MSQLNPNDFVITRKRKKYKFAKFSNAINCFEFEQWQKKAYDVIELGAGTGLFSLALAQRHPDKQILAIDVKGDRLQKGAYLALEKGVENITFLRARADQIEDIVPYDSLESLWITFPDPFPKKRSAGRRMTHPTFLAKYKNVLSRTGALYLKHDNTVFFHWSLEQLVAENWRIDELSFDLHESDLSDDYKILTTYEQRWLSEGLTTNFVRAGKI